ncbi:MAG: cyclase family protein [Gemmatimonadota bacterium]
MAFRDISVIVRAGVAEWPGDTPYGSRWTMNMSTGDSVNVSAMVMSPHVGTHADAPVHVKDGWPGTEILDLRVLNGPAIVADVRGRTGEISFADLGLPPEGRLDRVLLRTDCTIAKGEFPATWPVLAHKAVLALLDRGLRLLGVDTPSIDARESKDLRNHIELFTCSVHIVENLDLREVPAGRYYLRAMPIRVASLDAAPLRAILEDIEDASG